VISGFRRDAAVNCALLGYEPGVVAIYYRRFGTTYHFSLRNNPEERSFQEAILLYPKKLVTAVYSHYSLDVIT